jgi:hypothetical protein
MCIQCKSPSEAFTLSTMSGLYIIIIIIIIIIITVKVKLSP